MSDSFVHHEACPSCGSRDNLARYKSGSAYCFGCGYYEGSKRAPWTLPQDDEDDKPLRLPDDCSTQYSQEVLDWVGQYGLSIPELIKNHVLYSPSWNQLIFAFFGKENELLLWQGRNFSPELRKKSKYFTQGDVASVLPIYHSKNTSKSIVIVEDCVSAMKISRVSDAMPAFSSSISKEKLSKLRFLYSRIIFWLDGNMYDNAQKLDQQARLLGFTSSVVYTPLDPKEYSNTDINALLNTIGKE